ncbi:MAG: CPBP family intramembrane metalloprotease [Anaerolineae bacterium]|nr:CPBP family intramembrane metalloprotease [Anaerolineae bacterium]
MNNSNPADPPSYPPSIPSVPWTPRDVTWGLVVFVLWVLFLLVASLLGEQLALPVDVGLVVIFGEAVLLVPVWYFTVYKYRAGWRNLGLQGFHLAAVGVGCGLMILSFVFNAMYAALLALFDLQIQPDIELIFDATAYPLALLFGGVVVAPFVEEVFFRGFIFTGLIQKWAWKKAALVSAGLFAFAHFVPTSFLPIFILGLIFAFLYRASGSIWPAILMHMLTNAVALGVVYAASQGWLPMP